MAGIRWELLGHVQEAWEQSRHTTPPKQAPRATLRQRLEAAAQAASEVSVRPTLL